MDQLITTKEVLDKYNIPKKFLDKIEKDLQLTKIKKGRYNFYYSEEIDNAISQFSDEKMDEVRNGKLDPRNKLNDLTGKQWIPETKSFFYQKGLGSKHPHAQIEKQHPAPFSYQDIQRLIKMFTKLNETVLDPFSGVGSTLKAAALTNRKGIGIELSKKWASLSKERLETEVAENESKNHLIINGDSRIELTKFESNSIDFIVTSPPYWAILNKKADHKVKKERLDNNLATNYSTDLKDLGNIDEYEEFLNVLCNDIFFKSAQLLKPQKYMAIVVSDFRNQSDFISFHSDLIQKLNHLEINDSFKLSIQGVKVLLQNHKSLLPYGYPFAYVENIHHQYILIFRKVKL